MTKYIQSFVRGPHSIHDPHTAITISNVETYFLVTLMHLQFTSELQENIEERFS